jgi:integrase/recombinase XerD
MANREVSLYKRVSTNRGLRYCPVVTSKNGRIKPDAVLVDGKEEQHPEGTYYLSWYEGRKLRRIAVGGDANEASVRRFAKEAELRGEQNLRVNGRDLAPVNGNDPRRLDVVVADYLEEIKLTKKPKTYAAYSTALKYFQESCPKKHLEDIDRKDLLRFAVFLRDEKDQSPRTVNVKFGYLMIFLKAQGALKKNKKGVLTPAGIGKNDWPQFTEEEPEIYEQEELDKLFAACDEEERLWFEFFLMTGEREQEVMYTYWTDINLTHATVRVTHKPDRNWTPKAYKEREIPIPTKLVTALRARKAKSDKTCNLLFPTAGCKPKLDFLDCLKACAERAGLDKENFWLHKFRATFATWALWKGVDLRTVQTWLGHSDMESTMRYLKPSRSQQVHEKVNEIFG